MARIAATDGPRIRAATIRLWPLLASIAVTVVVAGLFFGILGALHLNAPVPHHWPSFAPAGPVIGIIWIVLFAAMGAARYLAATSGRTSARTDAWAVVGLLAFCLAYPLYTHLIPGHATELVGNTISFVYALWLAARLRAGSPLAAAFIGVVAAWIAFATALVFALIQLNGWST
jgi:tryptophan-rich sensory protein